jgi:hypothetical protein
MKTISLDCTVGIYKNSEYTARVYADKIIVTVPYVKWEGNSGGYAERKVAIRSLATVTAVLRDLEDDCELSAWGRIGRAIDDGVLSQADYEY